MISGNAPDGTATTGVPQASASIATSELVSAAMLAEIRHRAADSSRRLRANGSGPRKRWRPVSRGATCSAKYRRWSA